MTAITNRWLIAALACLALGSAWHLDGPDDHQLEWAQASELRAAQATEAGTARREAAGQAICTAERGPNSEARWTPAGDLTCTTRRRLVAVQGAQ